MSVNFELSGELRQDKGKGASRRLRHQNRVPAIMYGGDEAPVAITFNHDDLAHQLANEAFYSHILDLKVDGSVQKVVLKDLQRHPSKPRILHLDLLRVSDKQKIQIKVPLHFAGEQVAPGIKEEGGVLSHLDRKSVG